MLRTSESQLLLLELELAEMEVVLTGVESGELSPNGEFHITEFEWEVLRRVTAWNSLVPIGQADLQGPVGFVWTPDQLEKLVEFGNNQAREKLRAVGITDSQLEESYDLLMGLLDHTASKNKGPTLAYVYDDELPELRLRKREVELHGGNIETDHKKDDIANHDTNSHPQLFHLNPVSTNPFRMLGVFANCTERELVRQAAQISRYADIGRRLEFDADLPFLGTFTRDADSVKTASAKVEQPSKKLQWAAFWFVNANHIDETALGHLKNGNVQKALEILSLAVKDKPITPKNYSSANNLSTLQLGYGTRDGNFEAPFFLRGIRLKGDFIESDAFDCFVELVLGKNSLIQRQQVEMNFVDEIIHFVSPFLNTPNGISTKNLISAFSSFSFEARSLLAGKFTAGPLQRIEAAIAQTKASRSDDPKFADYYGRSLFKATMGDLATLKATIGTDSVQYQISANKIAQEILQCSIDYFNELAPDYELGREDPGPGAMRLIAVVRWLEPTGEVKHRLYANAPTIGEWVDGKTDRENHLRIKSDVAFIRNSLEGFQDLKDDPTTAIQLLETCKPKLDQIGFVLGTDNEFYLMLSNAVASNALGMTVSALNALLERNQSSPTSHQWVVLPLLKNCLTDASRLMRLLTEFDLSRELRSRCEVNGRTIVATMSQLGMRTADRRGVHPSSRTSPSYNPRKTKSAPTNPSSNSVPMSSFADGTDNSIVRSLFAFALKHPFISLIICAFITGTAVNFFSGNTNTSVVNTNTYVVNTQTARSNTNANIVSALAKPVSTPMSTPTPKVERPKSGTVLSSGSKRRGNGELLVKNGTGNDALVKIIDISTDKAYREVYVRSGSDATITGIAPGQYELLFTTGQDYAPSIKKFLTNVEYSKFDNSLNYQESRNAYGVGFRKYEVTLNKVAHGNAPTSRIDESAFNK